MKTPQNIPTLTGAEFKHLQELLANPGLLARRHFMNACEEWLGKIYGDAALFLTTSGTRALELAAIAMNIQPGDEVIMPSYTFVSTANAFVLQGAMPVFVDIHPETMNMDERLVEAAITSKTKAITAVHYAGVACNIDALLTIAQKHGLLFLEDNAQGLLAGYKGRSLGTFGDLSTISFNYTKHIQAGEAGALVINNPSLVAKTEIAYEAGTNRREFLRNEAEFYEWTSTGSKFFPSEIVNAFILGQLELAEEVVNKRKRDWNAYYTKLQPLSANGKIELPVVPEGCEHNAHIFYIKTAGPEERKLLIDHLRSAEIQASFHYVPLHNAAYGTKVSRFNGEDLYTSLESGRLLRLPIYHQITKQQIEKVVSEIIRFYTMR